ncbi:MAG TPA: phytanoyl-CoA dioxygenase family protein [Candidatus Elarobacter sp.]
MRSTASTGAAPSRPWFESADWQAEAQRRRLDARERTLVERFRRDGFVVVEDARILDELDVDGIWTRNAEQFAPDGGGRMQDAWTHDPAVRAVATHPAVIDVLRLLYGREPLPFQTLNFLTGTEQQTHSDVIHFSSLPSGFMCGVWMALEDVSMRQGPLHYVPGSQLLPELDYEHLGIRPVDGEHTWLNPNTWASYAEYEQKIDALTAENGVRREELAIRRGSFLVWSANLLHGGSPRDDRSLTRKSQVTHYYFDNVVPFTPMFSRRSQGRYATRRLRDIRTGRWIVPSIDGTPVVFPHHGDVWREIRPIHGLAGTFVKRILAVQGGLPVSPLNAVNLTARSAASRLGWNRAAAPR